MVSITIIDRQAPVSLANAAPTKQPGRSWGMGLPYTVIYQQKEPEPTRTKTSKTTRTTRPDDPSVGSASSITHLFISGSWGPQG